MRGASSRGGAVDPTIMAQLGPFARLVAEKIAGVFENSFGRTITFGSATTKKQTVAALTSLLVGHYIVADGVFQLEDGDTQPVMTLFSRDELALVTGVIDLADALESGEFTQKLTLVSEMFEAVSEYANEVLNGEFASPAQFIFGGLRDAELPDPTIYGAVFEDPKLVHISYTVSDEFGTELMVHHAAPENLLSAIFNPKQAATTSAGKPRAESAMPDLSASEDIDVEDLTSLLPEHDEAFANDDMDRDSSPAARRMAQLQEQIMGRQARPTDGGRRAASPFAQMADAGAGPAVRPAQFSQLAGLGEEEAEPAANLDLIMDVMLKVTVELGRSTMSIREVLDISPGSVIELDKPAGEPVDIMVNDRLIAKGEVVVVDENFGVRVTEIASPARRIASLR